VHGACRHKPRFHRFDQENANSSTDDRKDERVAATPALPLQWEAQAPTLFDVCLWIKFLSSPTVLRGLHFGTVESLLNCHITTAAACLDKVRKIYRRRGFKVTIMNADPKFAPLQDMFGDISFKLCAQDEHVPKVERYICTVKDWARSGTIHSTTAERRRSLCLDRPSTYLYWENRSHGLRARSLLTLKELDQPQVKSNLNESPQE
jgi:hypothetical protein